MDAPPNRPKQVDEQAEAYLHLLHALGSASARALEDPSDENDAAFEAALGRVTAFEKMQQHRQITAGQTLLDSLLEPAPPTPEPTAGWVTRWRNWLQTILQPPTASHGTNRWRAPVMAAVMGLAALVVILLAALFLQRGAPTGQITLAQAVTPAITVLDVQGAVTYTRQGWTDQQAVVSGTQLGIADPVVAEAQASMRVLCPDGSIAALSGAQMPTNGTVPCPTDEATILGQTEARPAIVLMGGQQNPAAPYLLSPRATAVRSPSVELLWHAVPDATQYTLTVRAGIEVVWESGALAPEETTTGDVAALALPLELAPDTAYTVVICVLYANLQRVCTTDPGVASDANLAFYYHPVAALEQVEQQITASLGADTPDSLYARALVLSQPFYVPPVGDALGFYQEALGLLQQVVADFPESPLARSAELHNLQGELFSRVNLPQSANLAYQQARALAPPQTQAAAVAALGAANTTPDSAQAIQLYDEAVATYAAFLDAAAFEARFSTLCAEIGDICLALTYCQDHLDQCAQWAE